MRLTSACCWVSLLALGCSDDPFLIDDAGTATDSGGEAPDSGSSEPMADAPAMASLRLTDGDGQRWHVDGRAAEGASSGLASLPGHNAFWFAWSVFHGGTSVWGREENIRDQAIPGCDFPCDRWYRGGCGAGTNLDCIPPLDSPAMVSPEDAEAEYLAPNDMVFGILTSEGPRAYPHNILWWHEIANEQVGDEAFAITFCPLTGSGLLFDRRGFRDGETVRLGVSGRLYNSNLTIWDSTADEPLDESFDDISFWPQMRIEATGGPQAGRRMPLQGVLEMTWEGWRSLHPDTTVVSGNTGFSRDYTQYPYILGGDDYRTDDSNTFSDTNPPPDAMFENKDMVFGLLVEGEARAYVWKVLEERTGERRGVVMDELGGVPVAVVFDLDRRFVHAFDRRVSGTAVNTLELVETPDT